MKYTLLSAAITALLLGSGGALANEAKFDVPELWKKSCASCHGQDGKAQTKTGQRLKVKDLTEAKVQAAFTDEEAFKNLKFGKKEGDREIKKPFESKLSDEQLQALVAHVRKFAKK
jgi:cytochrome c6